MTSNYEMSGDLFRYKLKAVTARRQQEILDDEMYKYQRNRYKKRLREDIELEEIDREEEVIKLKGQVAQLQQMILELQFELNRIVTS